MVIFRVSLAPS